MTEKDNASMTTVQMKADYAASEVYSTASEPPPAYKRQSNSVKIAKITAFTIIVSSFVLGSFILASSYLQARASCDQVQALDSVLEKELMLETLQQVNKELPRAEALVGRELNTDNDLQTLDKEGGGSDSSSVKKVVQPTQQQPNKFTTNVASEDEMSMNENRYDDKDEIIEEEVQKYPGKLPLELDLSDLAAALLQNNKKSRMNCVVERKHAEELVDSPSKTVALPFGMNLTTDPKKARITGERISIFCEGGNENKEQDMTNQKREEEEEGNDEETEIVRPMFIPIQRLPIPFGRMPSQYPLTHMPQRMMPPQMMQPQHHYHFQQQQQQQPQQQREVPEFSFHHQSPTPFQNYVREIPISAAFIQQLPMRPPMPPQVMQAPPPQLEPTLQQQQQPPHPQQRVVRIHVQQIPIREVIHAANDVPIQITPPQIMNSDNMPPRPYHQMQSQSPQLQQHQQLPQVVATPSASPLQLQLQRLFGPSQHQQAPQPQQMPRMPPQPQAQATNQEMPLLQIQRMPLGMALERAGITPEDLANIQRMTEERMNDVIRHLTNTDSDEDGSNSSSEEDEADEAVSPSASPAMSNGVQHISQSSEQEKAQIQQEQQQQQYQQQHQQQQQQMQMHSERQGRMHEMPVQRLILQPLPEQPRDTMTPPMPDVASMTRLPHQIAQTSYGRSLANPVRIPVPMMQAQADMSLQEDDQQQQQQQHPVIAEDAVTAGAGAGVGIGADTAPITADESARPHFVQPRSV